MKNPVETAEYTVASKINNDPLSSGGSLKPSKKQQAFVAKVKSRYWRTMHKFGVELPHRVEEAYKIDKQNRNDYW